MVSLFDRGMSVLIYEIGESKVNNTNIVTIATGQQHNIYSTTIVGGNIILFCGS